MSLSLAGCFVFFLNGGFFFKKHGDYTRISYHLLRVTTTVHLIELTFSD